MLVFSYKKTEMVCLIISSLLSSVFINFLWYSAGLLSSKLNFVRKFLLKCQKKQNHSWRKTYRNRICLYRISRYPLDLIFSQICMYMCVWVYVHAYVHVYVHVYVCMCLCACLYVHVFVCNVYVCVHVYMYVYMFVCMWYVSVEARVCDTIMYLPCSTKVRLINMLLFS